MPPNLGCIATVVLDAPVLQPRLGRQLAGGFSDVGTIVVSVVHAVGSVGRTLVGAPLTDPGAGQSAVD
ncbi:hypothetical protein [Mycolicibacterium pyrenivorans]|uniref:hypothetical protein n=1 Tax=Mycolicibacterium pyrenivorans TaxID=187102 RepID=UPI0021F3667C|nr:hypothetical protein [Mycolicibacterium pyrenivorans]MCV7151543.1 hypothetical protein [Mycolicibacterium pyrenivorans]